MFYILLHDYFISHQLLTRHCSLHLFWRGKQIMWVKVKFSVFRTISGFNFIPWERVIFFYMGSFSWKGKVPLKKIEKCITLINRLAYELLSNDIYIAFRRQHLCPFHFHVFCFEANINIPHPFTDTFCSIIHVFFIIFF
jgi:hypothetical protein